MSYRLKRQETVIESVRRIASEQIDKAVASLRAYGEDPVEAVHDARKRCKKIRGLLRLVRPGLGATYSQENAAFRDLARTLSDLRDAAAVRETVTRLTERDGVNATDRRVLSGLQRRLAQLHMQARSEVDGLGLAGQAIQAFEAARSRLDDWELSGDPIKAIRKGLARTSRRARKAWKTCRKDPTPENLHEWRKRAKYHRYHCRLLRDLWPAILSARRDEAKRLSDLLGWDHDLVVLDEITADDPRAHRALERLEGLVEAAHEAYVREALDLGARMHAEKPSHLARRMAAYAVAWKDGNGS